MGLGQPHQQLHDLIRDLLTEGAQTDQLRGDVAPDELASYCLHPLQLLAVCRPGLRSAGSSRSP